MVWIPSGLFFDIVSLMGRGIPAWRKTRRSRWYKFGGSGLEEIIGSNGSALEENTFQWRTPRCRTGFPL